MTMKFNVKSALPSTAVVLLSLMAAGKATKVYSASTGAYSHTEINSASIDASDTQFIEDTFSSGDTFCSGDSFGSGDSFCAGDSCSSTMCGKSYGVFIIERDTYQDNNVPYPDIDETLYVKKLNKGFIAQSLGSFKYPSFHGDGAVIATGKFKPHKDLLTIEYVSDPSLNSKKTTNFRLSPVPGTDRWAGTWKNGKTKGDAVVNVTFDENQYFSYGCDYYLGQ